MAIAKTTEISSSSTTSFEDAIKTGISRASRSIRGIKGFWVQDQKGVVDGGNVVEYRVTMKVTFVLED